MSCFFRCFRAKDSNPNPVVTPTVNVGSRSKNALSSLFQCDEGEPLRNKEQLQNQLAGGLYVDEAKDEAEFVKARGTLPDAHLEIIKASENWEGKSYSLVDSPSSCITDGQNTRSDVQDVTSQMDVAEGEIIPETSAVSCHVFSPSVQYKNNSVHFDRDFESSTFSSKGSSVDYESPHLQQSGSASDESVAKPSPSPIPLNLTDEMQTPGIFSPAHANLMADNEMESLKLESEDDLVSTPMPESTKKQFSSGKEAKNEASLSDWLKPVSPKINRVRRKTPGDRPILGMVAAHWKDEDTSHVSPTWWGGNGIPNSTNKYKEDQKVNWHATPFEERLEKALSEETFVSQRKPMSRTPLFDLSESEESDTATFSHLQPSDHIKPVVSF